MSGQPSESDFPTADTRASRSFFREHGTRLWWLTLSALLLAAALFAASALTRGPLVTVRFREGHGIQPGDALRHRGIEVGRIESVRILPALEAIDVRVRLDRNAADLAREGGRFWIERPQVSLARVSGLDTVVGSKFIRVLPGPAGGAAMKFFEGLEAPLQILEAATSEIRVRFAEGHGLAQGDSVRYRGIQVGEITAVRLDEELNRVEVDARLVASAARLARAGSRFWIERPQVSLAGIRSLGTLVGGRYLAVEPGPESAEPLALFDGLEIPPSSERPSGGLEIILESRQRNSLAPEIPVTYRGIRVGHVVSTGLSTDAVTVEARLYIRPEYRALIREETRFFSVSGFDLRLGWSGLKVDADSLETIATGGIALAVPDESGDPVNTGHRFELHGEAPEEWLSWKPRIALGSALLPEGAPLPRMIRASLRWKFRTLGIRRNDRRSGWVLPLEGDRWLGPVDLLTPPADARRDEASLELVGRKLPIAPETAEVRGRLATVRFREEDPEPRLSWEPDRIRRPDGPEDCLVVSGDATLPIGVGRITLKEEFWHLDRSIPLDAEWHGASVLSRADGHLIGVLLHESGRALVYPLTDVEWLAR